ncbi:MAG: GtrA family protein [Ruminococcus sp.]|nr:GtrA family protein [Ruminococcus sp.]
MDLKKLISGKTDNTFIQFFRYLFVGGAATVVDWGSSYIIFRFVFGNKYAVAANVISFILGLVTNYLISTVWVFDGSKVKNKFAEFLSFAAIGVVGLLLTIGITKLFEIKLSDVTDLYQLIGKVVSTAAAFFWNFFARKYLLYNNKK